MITHFFTYGRTVSQADAGSSCGGGGGGGGAGSAFARGFVTRYRHPFPRVLSSPGTKGRKASPAGDGGGGGLLEQQLPPMDFWRGGKEEKRKAKKTNAWGIASVHREK